MTLDRPEGRGKRGEGEGVSVGEKGRVEGVRVGGGRGEEGRRVEYRGWMEREEERGMER